MLQQPLRFASLCALGLLILASCQMGPDASSEAYDDVLVGAAPPGPCDMCSIIKGTAGNQCKAVCENIVANPDNASVADLGSKELLAIAFSEWRAGNLLLKRGTTAEQALESYNAAVRDLGGVRALGEDEKHVWTRPINLTTQDLVAAGPANPDDTFCFPSGRWCFQVGAPAGYLFAAEAIAEVDALGECVGSFANDCEQIGVHVDVSPDLVEDDDPDTYLNVWSCSEDFVTRHARFAVLGNGNLREGVLGDELTDGPPLGFVCAENGGGGLQLSAGRAGTTFGAASKIQGASILPRVRIVLFTVSAKFASISDGAEILAFEDGTTEPVVRSCTTSPAGKKTGSCSVELPVPVDDTCYDVTVDKQEQTGTAHHADVEFCLWPGAPDREQFLSCTVNLTTGEYDCPLEDLPLP